VALPVPIPAREAALAWLTKEEVKEPERWLAYAGGAPLLAVEEAARGPVALAPVNDREALEPLAEAIQKTALDRALLAFSLPAKYRTSTAVVPGSEAGAWLKVAREVGQDRLLCRHPLNPRLFSWAMLAKMRHLT
jgi:DNA polymerase-3 subunit delta'